MEFIKCPSWACILLVTKNQQLGLAVKTYKYSFVHALKFLMKWVITSLFICTIVYEPYVSLLCLSAMQDHEDGHQHPNPNVDNKIVLVNFNKSQNNPFRQILCFFFYITLFCGSFFRCLFNFAMALSVYWYLRLSSRFFISKQLITI